MGGGLCLSVNTNSIVSSTIVNRSALNASIIMIIFSQNTANRNTVTAQVLAELLDIQKPTQDQLRKKLPTYLIAAIEYVTASLLQPPVDANAN